MFADFLISSNANDVTSLGMPGVSFSVFLVNKPAPIPPIIGTMLSVIVCKTPPVRVSGFSASDFF